MALTQLDLTPSELAGLIFIVIAIILYLVLGLYLLNSFRKSKRNSTLYMSLIFLFGSLALVSLIIEQLLLIASGVTEAQAPPMKSFLSFSVNEINVFWLSYLFAFIAWVTSASAVFSACFFTQSFLSDKYKKALIIPAIMLILFVVVYTYAPFQWKNVDGDWQPNHGDLYEIVGYIFLFPNLWMVVVLFFYLTFSLFRRGIPRWKQTLILAFGQLFLSIGFTVEIINIQDPMISLLSRFAVMMYPIVMWLGFAPPNWFKRTIGAET
ncbi:MAG: hypothetical protein ACXACU_10425 [Candidatus Hodarchaeales archaeon]|jgi:hypothetical protein